MAETKVSPSYQVTHVDGVMHLSVQSQQESPIAPEKLRVQPPSLEDLD